VFFLLPDKYILFEKFKKNSPCENPKEKTKFETNLFSPCENDKEKQFFETNFFSWKHK